MILKLLISAGKRVVRLICGVHPLLLSDCYQITSCDFEPNQSSSPSLGTTSSELRRQLMSDNDLVGGYIITFSLSSKASQSVTFSHTFNQATNQLNCVLIKRYLFYTQSWRNWMPGNCVGRCAWKDQTANIPRLINQDFKGLWQYLFDIKVRKKVNWQLR